MNETERENTMLVTAISLFNGEIEEQTHAGDLHLIKEDSGVWEVYAEEQTPTNIIQIYIDTIRPAAFPSARILAAYLRDLDDADPDHVDLPDDPDRFTGAMMEVGLD